MSACDCPCGVGIPRANRDRLQTMLAIRDQVAIGHDEARTDAAHSDIVELRNVGEMVEIEEIGRCGVHNKALKLLADSVAWNT